MPSGQKSEAANLELNKPNMGAEFVEFANKPNMGANKPNMGANKPNMGAHCIIVSPNVPPYLAYLPPYLAYSDFE